MPVVEVSEEGLQVLDFTPVIPCTGAGEVCGAAAKVVMRCRTVPARAYFLCAEHEAEMLAETAELIREHGAIRCRCGDEGPRLSDVAEVIEL